MQIQLQEIRTRAEKCLANSFPSSAEAHELAVLVLSLVARLEASKTDLPEDPIAGEHPYRTHAPRADASVGHPTNLEASIALERALEACQKRLRHTLSELDRLRGTLGGDDPNR